MSHQYRTGWCQEVLTVLSDQARDLPDTGTYAELVDSLDIANCIRIFDRCWNDVFRKTSFQQRSKIRMQLAMSSESTSSAYVPVSGRSLA